MSSSFKDKIVIVTGANNGIGAATAALFLEHGAKVAALDIRESNVPPTESRFDVTCDVSSEESVNAAVKQVVDKWNTIDVLCNVAGVMDRNERISETSNEQWRRVLGINLDGVFYMTRAVIPHFLAKDASVGRRGAIVNTGSVAAVLGGAAGMTYTTSKHAVLGLSRSTAFMYAKEGITCNIVIPGGVKTNIMVNSGSQDLDPIGHKTLTPSHARMMGIAEPIDIARAIVFLAGADSINGAELTVDHGWSSS